MLPSRPLPPKRRLFPPAPRGASILWDARSESAATALRHQAPSRPSGHLFHSPPPLLRVGGGLTEPARNGSTSAKFYSPPLSLAILRRKKGPDRDAVVPALEGRRLVVLALHACGGLPRPGPPHPIGRGGDPRTTTPNRVPRPLLSTASDSKIGLRRPSPILWVPSLHPPPACRCPHPEPLPPPPRLFA